MAWTNDPLTAGNIYWNKVHFTDLHETLYAKYVEAGLTADTFVVWSLAIFTEFYTDESSFKSYIRNDWIYEIRNAIGASGILSVCGYSSLAELLNVAIGQTNWTDPILTAGNTYIRNDHIEELRSAIGMLIPTGGETWLPAEVKTYSQGNHIYGVAKDYWDVFYLVDADTPVPNAAEIILDGENKKFRAYIQSSISHAGGGRCMVGILTTPTSLPVGDIFYNKLITVNTHIKLDYLAVLDGNFGVAVVNVVQISLYFTDSTFINLPIVSSEGSFSGEFDLSLSAYAGKYIKQILLFGQIQYFGSFPSLLVEFDNIRFQEVI